MGICRVEKEKGFGEILRWRYKKLAEALNKFDGAIILISHMEEFVKEIKVDETLDLGKL